MVRNGGLRKCDSLLNIAGAHSYGFTDGAAAFLLQHIEDLQPRWIRDSFEAGDELFLGKWHVENYLSNQHSAGSLRRERSSLGPLTAGQIVGRAGNRVIARDRRDLHPATRKNETTRVGDPGERA